MFAQLIKSARRRVWKIPLVLALLVCLFGCLRFYLQRCYPISPIESLPEKRDLLAFTSRMSPRCTLRAGAPDILSLYIVDTSTGELMQWEMKDEIETRGVYSWSSRRKQLLIEGYANQETRVIALSPDGSADKLPLTSSFDYAWSPDAKRVAFSYRDQVYVQNVDGTGLKQLTHFGTSTYASWPDWSPDGEYLVFTLVEDRSATICRMNQDGTGLIALTDHLAGNSREPKWSPDGTKIAFLYAAELDQPSTLWLMNPDGSRTRELLEPHPSGNLARGVKDHSWAPNSDQIAFFSGWDGPCSPSGDLVGTNCSESIYLIDADGTNLTRLTYRIQFESNLVWIP